MLRCPISFPTLRSASLYIAAERALTARARQRNNVVVIAGIECLRDSETPILDVVAEVGRRDRPVAEMAVSAGRSA